MSDVASRRLETYLNPETFARFAKEFADLCPLPMGLYDLRGNVVGASNDLTLPASISELPDLLKALKHVSRNCEPRSWSRGKTYIIVPVESCEGCIGTLIAGAEADSDSAGATRLLHCFGRLFGQLIEGERTAAILVDELDDRYEELSSLCSMTAALDTAKPHREALGDLFRAIGFSLDSDFTLIAVPNQDCFHASSARTLPAEAWPELSRELLARIEVAKDSVAINTLAFDEKLNKRANGFVHLAATPIEIDGDAGVLAVFRDRADRRMDMNDLRTLETVARQVSVFLANNRHETMRERDYAETLTAVAQLVEARSDESGQHAKRVGTYCRVLAQSLRHHIAYRSEIDDAFITCLESAGALHDLGNVGIPDAILLKRGPLTPAEFEVVQAHTETAYEALRPSDEQDSPLLRMTREIAGAHHEAWDGAGYPRGLAGSSIPLAARIVAVADTYDALTTPRCYRRPVSHGEAVDTIQQVAGRQLDPGIVEVFIDIQEQFETVLQESDGVLSPAAALVEV